MRRSGMLPRRNPGPRHGSFWMSLRLLADQARDPGRRPAAGGHRDLQPLELRRVRRRAGHADVLSSRPRAAGWRCEPELPAWQLRLHQRDPGAAGERRWELLRMGVRGVHERHRVLRRLDPGRAGHRDVQRLSSRLSRRRAMQSPALAIHGSSANASRGSSPPRPSTAGAPPPGGRRAGALRRGAPGRSCRRRGRSASAAGREASSPAGPPSGPGA